MMVDTLTDAPSSLTPTDIEHLRQELISSRTYFATSSNQLTEEHSGFAPKEGTMTVAQQVAHVAHTLDWFREGMTRPEGFDLDFEDALVAYGSVKSLDEARAWLDKAFDQVLGLFDEKPAEFWTEALPEGPVMGGKPRETVVSAIVDHTAHHRGVLTVYARLLGLQPTMPYM